MFTVDKRDDRWVITHHESAFTLELRVKYDAMGEDRVLLGYVDGKETRLLEPQEHRDRVSAVIEHEIEPLLQQRYKTHPRGCECSDECKMVARVSHTSTASVAREMIRASGAEELALWVRDSTPSSSPCASSGSRSAPASTCPTQAERITMATIWKADGRSDTARPENGWVFSLEEMKAVVGGYIEVVRLNDRSLMIVNEEGHLVKLPPNLMATRLYREMAERNGHVTDRFVVGDVLVCTLFEGGTPWALLTREEQAQLAARRIGPREKKLND